MAVQPQILRSIPDQLGREADLSAKIEVRHADCHVVVSGVSLVYDVQHEGASLEWGIYGGGCNMVMALPRLRSRMAKKVQRHPIIKFSHGIAGPTKGGKKESQKPPHLAVYDTSFSQMLQVRDGNFASISFLSSSASHQLWAV